MTPTLPLPSSLADLFHADVDADVDVAVDSDAVIYQRGIEVDMCASRNEFLGAFTNPKWWLGSEPYFARIDLLLYSSLPWDVAVAIGSLARTAHPFPAPEAIQLARSVAAANPSLRAWPKLCCERWLRDHAEPAWWAAVRRMTERRIEEALDVARALAEIVDAITISDGQYAQGAGAWDRAEAELVKLAHRREDLASLAWVLEVEKPVDPQAPSAIEIGLRQLDTYVQTQVLDATPGLDAFDARDPDLFRAIAASPHGWWLLDGCPMPDEDVLDVVGHGPIHEPCADGPRSRDRDRR
jgi:hypothetical protein